MSDIGTNTYAEMQDAFESFTGADIQAIFTYKDTTGNMQQKVVGTLSAITISVVREINPLFGFGSPDLRAVSKGKRSISGTLTFTVFDRDPLVRDIMGVKAELAALSSQFNNMYTDTTSGTAGQLNSGNFGNFGGVVGGGTNGFAAAGRQQGVMNAKNAISSLYSVLSAQPLRYADQLAPFDITISLINDRGAASVAAVRQIYLVSQGTGHSMHDLESDMVYSYIARYYEPLQPLTQMLHSLAVS